MMRSVLLALLVALCVSALVLAKHRPLETLPTKGLVVIPEAAPPCPWRNAQADLTNWFPGATGYSISDQILSGKRLELQKRLGRSLLPEENALHIYIIARNTAPLGTVLTRRFKGSGGAMEIALALDPQNTISAFKIQRMREPREIVQALEALNLDEQLQGKSVNDDLRAIDTRNAPPTVKDLAINILEAVRSLLVLNEAAQTNRIASHH
jgi:hypothetical protein